MSFIKFLLIATIVVIICESSSAAKKQPCPTRCSSKYIAIFCVFMIHQLLTKSFKLQKIAVTAASWENIIVDGGKCAAQAEVDLE